MRTLAYLDPGSGSMILQMLLGGIAAVAVSIKMFGKKIFSTLAFWKKDEPEKASARVVHGGRLREGSGEGDRLAPPRASGRIRECRPRPP